MDQVMQAIEAQQTALSVVICALMNDQGRESFILTHEELQNIASKYTVRVEMTTPQQPETSSLKISVITVEEARKLVAELQQKFEKLHTKRQVVTHEKKKN